LFIAHQAIGKAITEEIRISRIKLFDRIAVILKTDAPSTFLIPISFMRCSALKAANPNNPMQPIKMAMIVNIQIRLPRFSSALYILP
jgi:hypothetical protein